MKKVISFILALVLVISTMPLSEISITAGAVGEDVDIPINDEYPILTLDAPQTVEIDEENIDVYLKFIPEEDGTYAFYSNTDEDTCGYIFDSQFIQLLYDDDTGEELNFKLIYQMNAGETYYICPRFLNEGTYGSFDVFAKKIKTLSNLEIVSLPDNLEYYEGCVENLDYTGLMLKATWSDGTTTEHEIGNDENFIGEYSVTVFGSENINEDGIVYIHCADFELSFTLTLVENPVDSIEVLPSEINWIANTIGTYEEYYDEETDELKEYFYYEYSSYAILDEINVKINYNDGTSKTVIASENVDGYSFNYNSNQSYSTPWTVDSENYFTISYLGKEARVSVKIAPSPVESIEVVSGEISCIENANGYYALGNNEETGEEKEYFYYQYSMPNDLKIKINYISGDSKIALIDEEIDGYTFNLLL